MIREQSTERVSNTTHRSTEALRGKEKKDGISFSIFLFDKTFTEDKN